MAKEYIERDVVMPAVEMAVELYNSEYNDIEHNINAIPAADVVEVVRCRNCKHKVNFQNRIMCDRNARYSAVHSEWYGLTATDNDNFCSYGERKDGVDDE